MPKTTKTIIAKKISFNLNPEELETFNDHRGSLNQTEFIKGKILNNIVISDNILNNTDIINTELREVNEKMIKYRDLYNTLLQWIEDGKLGRTNSMVESEKKRLEAMEKW